METQLPSPKGHSSNPLSVHVYCGQTDGWIRMPLSMEAGFGPGHIVLDGDPPPPKRGQGHSPHFSANVCCGQTAGWIKMPLDTEVDLGAGDVVEHVASTATAL